MNFKSHFEDLTTVTACLQKRDELMNSGRVSEIKETIKTAIVTEKKELGKELNILRSSIQDACDEAIKMIQKEQEKDSFLNFDPTFASTNYKELGGNLHPLSYVIEEIIESFASMGFDVYDSDLIASQWDNFSAVNVPDFHPARQMQDTFFLKQKDEKGEQFVMRTHTSMNISKYAKLNKPPFKAIFPGLVFRNEDIDATHDVNFVQFDMWLIQKKSTMAELTTLIKSFLEKFLDETEIDFRVRPSFFPFVTPGIEADIRRVGEGKWVEVVGAGPIHPDVIKNLDLDPNEWEGLAFGFGVDRLAQMKLGITGISQLYNGHVEFLQGE